MTIVRNSFWAAWQLVGEQALPPLAKAKVVYLPVGLQHQFDDQHSVRLGYVNEVPANAYKHQSIGLSYAFKF